MHIVIHTLGPTIKELYVAINVLILFTMIYFLVVTCCDWTKQVLWAPLFLLMLTVVYSIIGYYEVGTAVGILQISITALIYAYLIELKLKSDRDCHQTVGCIRDDNSDGTHELHVCLPPEISETSLCAENLVAQNLCNCLINRDSSGGETLVSDLYGILNVAIMTMLVYFLVVIYNEWPQYSIVVATLSMLIDKTCQLIDKLGPIIKEIYYT
ncbi:unnamed protein product [Medioppia subpectinata]|uniref:Uncharacterized protein n=1 Tax=Medioppia subpectinata TaxID=1979941 RepID=A0A7R9KEG3_9ACAR|nr:unnamed protein product [Medioppia subpectinata]CAG2101829.1 unnamed protein product [Medioppia subpectinata]